MSKESKILLATVIVCTLFLAGLQLLLNNRLVATNVRIAQALDKGMQGSTEALKGKLDKMSASPSASVSAAPSGRKASPTGKAKATASASAEATPEATPTE